MKSYAIDGARLGQARQALTDENGKRLTQAEAARILGVHTVTLNRIENGKARASLELLERICELTGKSRIWLLGEEEPVDPFEVNRARLAVAVQNIADGFDLLNELMNDVSEKIADQRAVRNVA